MNAPFPDHCLLVPLSVTWPTGAPKVFLFCFRFSVMLFGARGSQSLSSLFYLRVLVFFINLGRYHGFCPW